MNESYHEEPDDRDNGFHHTPGLECFLDIQIKVFLKQPESRIVHMGETTDCLRLSKGQSGWD